MAFIQIIEFTTTHQDQVQSLMDGWVASTEGKRKGRRSTIATERDRPAAYVQVVEFASYEEAMANSNLPETNEFAQRLAKLCDHPPTFRNLEVQRVDDLS